MLVPDRGNLSLASPWITIAALLPLLQDSFFEGGQWWATHPHSLELIFHQRLETHLCITTDPDVADLFYVPFYASQSSPPSPTLPPHHPGS